MKIRTKVVALLSAVFFVLALVEWGVGRALLLPRFEAIELDNARTAMTRIDYGVHQTLNELQTSATDWGNWKDTYQFILDHNERYQRGNLSESALKQLHLTTLTFIDAEGNIVLSKSLDPESDSFLPQGLFAQGSLPLDFPWRDKLRDGRGANGFILTDRGVLFSAVGPILDGFGHGPSRGLVLMGRLLSAAEIADIGARAQTSVALVAARGGSGPSRSLAQLHDPTGSGETVAVSDTTTQISRVFADIYGNPIMTLRVDVPRTITEHARTTVADAMAFTVGAAVAVLLVLLGLLDRTVLTPLARVTRHAVAIGAGDDLTPRLNLERKDEIGALAAEIDRMVAQIAESRRQLVDHSFESGRAESSRGVLHNIGNAMTPLSVRLAKLQDRLRSAPTSDVERALAERELAASEAQRQADLDEFLRLASGELAEVVKAAADDVEVVARQAALVQLALNEQLHSSRAPTVTEAATLPAIINQSLEIVPDTCRELARVELDPSVHSVGPIHVARTVLRLVLQNLIINAAEAIRAAGRERGVVRFSAALVAEGGQSRLQLDCTDTGVGIAAENLERVFERGYSTKRGSGNLGIGLHWCATTVNALGGRIWASSAGHGSGATLHLVIPVPAAAAALNTAAA
jgi:two-component system NtrC family sensor kinase